MLAEIAHSLAVLPLAWLAWEAFRRRSFSGIHDRVWWLVATALWVSWAADTVAHVVPPSIVSAVYPLSQATLIGIAFLQYQEALAYLALLVVVGCVAVFWKGVEGPELFLRTVAWLSVGWLAYTSSGSPALRGALLVYFGLGWMGWIGYALWPGWTSWLIYQGTRVVGISLFCYAAAQVRPVLRLTPRAVPVQGGWR